MAMSAPLIGPHARDRRVVVEHVDAPEGLDTSRDPARGIALAGQLDRGERDDASGGLGDQALGLLRPGGVEVTADDGGAVGGEGERRRARDPCRRPWRR
jgi:hypothetical protein